MAEATEEQTETLTVSLSKKLVAELREQAAGHGRTVEEEVAAIVRHQKFTATLRKLQEAFAGVADEMGLTEDDILAGNF